MILLLIISSSDIEQKNINLIEYLIQNNIKLHIIEYGDGQPKNNFDNSTFINSSTYPIKFINTFIESLNDQNIFFINCNSVIRTEIN